MRIATRTRTTALAALALIAARTASAERRFCTCTSYALKVTLSPQKLISRTPAANRCGAFRLLPPAFLFAVTFTDYYETYTFGSCTSRSIILTSNLRR